MVITERAAIIGWRLRSGEQMTTAEVAELLGIQREAARVLMLKVCRVLPVAQIGGVWIAQNQKSVG